MHPSGYSKLVRRLKSWRPTTPVGLFYVDLVGLRNVNRLASPEVTDALVEAVAALLAQWVGADGVSGRLWSDEFIAAKAIDHPQEASAEAMELRAQIAALRYTGRHGPSQVHVSIGVICGRPAFDWPVLIGQAADACEVARERGINQISFYRPGDPLLPQVPVENDGVLLFRSLRDAGRLSLHPQPIMDISQGKPKIAKAEFLLRVQNGDEYLPPPPGMISDLEEHGLSSELDRFSSRFVLDWLEDNADILAEIHGISLNLSAQSFTDGIFMSDLYDDVRHARVPRDKLSFEITETAAIKHIGVAAEIIADFRELGVRFSLDDFGSGLCSFGYLQSLKVDEVKIDGRFIRELADSTVNQEIVRAIHQVARATGKTTVAEFVDAPEKLRLLQEIGLNYAQGWLFHRSVHPDVFRKLVCGEVPIASIGI